MRTGAHGHEHELVNDLHLRLNPILVKHRICHYLQQLTR